MLNVKYLPNKFTRLFSLAIVLNSVFLALAAPVNAQRRSQRTRVSDYGLPTHRRDGGSRGIKDSCVASAKAQNLMALIPEKSVGINVSKSPKLFFYVPEVDNQSTLEFVLRNEQDRLIYEAFLATEGNGIMSIEVPADVTASLLESDQNYHWYLSMICNDQQRSRDIVVEGWMRQETINSATQKNLNNASLAEKAEVYRQEGFWFDALSVLAENPEALRKQSRERQKWSEMLSSVGLRDLVSEPFIEAQLVDNPIK
ncbi:MAG: DUF928 domain-containing protein [Cyanobacteria bacterium J06600_6]